MPTPQVSLSFPFNSNTQVHRLDKIVSPLMTPTEAENGLMHFEDGRRDLKPRNGGSYWKLKKTGRPIPSQLPEGTSLLTPLT